MNRGKSRSRTTQGHAKQRKVERAMGIEPTAQAWEAWVLPLYDARYRPDSSRVPGGRQMEEDRGGDTSTRRLGSGDIDDNPGAGPRFRQSYQ